MAHVAITPVTLEPGNCTRYDLDIIRLGKYDLLVILYDDRTRIRGRTMRLSSSNKRCAYRPDLVSRGLGCDLAGAAVILVYLRDEQDVFIELTNDFNQETGVWVGHTIH